MLNRWYSYHNYEETGMDRCSSNRLPGCHNSWIAHLEMRVETRDNFKGLRFVINL